MSIEPVSPVLEVEPALRSVPAALTFIKPGPDKPYTYVGEPPAGVPATRGNYETHTVQVQDARPIAGRLGLDVEGIALARHVTAVRDFWDEAQTLALGHPEIAELVKQVTGAARVVVFDHTLRRRQSGIADRVRGEPRQPANRAHVDQTVLSGPQRVRDIMGDQADALLARRAAIINVWRPIGQPARDWPLALGDASSTGRDDLVASDLIFPHRKGETYAVAYNPAQRWLYVPDLQLDETLLIKCWDSDESVARFAPHTGFQDPTTPAGTPPRQSIEFRTIAFFN